MAAPAPVPAAAPAGEVEMPDAALAEPKFAAVFRAVAARWKTGATYVKNPVRAGRPARRT